MCEDTISNMDDPLFRDDATIAANKLEVRTAYKTIANMLQQIARIANTVTEGLQAAQVKADEAAVGSMPHPKPPPPSPAPGTTVALIGNPPGAAGSVAAGSSACPPEQCLSLSPAIQQQHANQKQY